MMGHCYANGMRQTPYRAHGRIGRAAFYGLQLGKSDAHASRHIFFAELTLVHY